MNKKLTESRVLTLCFLFCSGVGLGTLSLLFAAVVDRKAMFLSYFQNPLIALLNLAPVVLLVFLLYFVTSRAWLSFLLSSVLVMALTLVNWFKLQFRDDPFLFEDILLIKEAGNMAGKYQLFLTKTMVLAALLVVAGALFLLFLARGRMSLWPRMGGLAILILIALPLKAQYASAQVYDAKTVNNDLINQWSATQVYVSKGFIYPFLHSITAGADTPPAGYSEKAAQSILAAYEDTDIPENKKVNVISLMLESYNDFTKYGVPELNPDVYDVYHALESEGYSGNLITNIFAGGTVDSERCFLTGYSDLGSFRTATNSYPWYFRSQGYTATGAHPCFNWFYNRLNINENIGFQDYKFVENYFSPMTNGDVGLDNIFFPELIKLWEARDKSKPFFAYDLSYQGHGPYNDDRTWFGDDAVVDNGSYTPQELNILNNYFGSIRDTNEHLKEFFDYYRTASEPVVIVAFGDHNPWLGDAASIYHTLGIDLDFSTEQGLFNYYGTRYLIWANDAAKKALGNDFQGEGPDIGPYFLMNEVFRLCGWKGPAFMQSTQQIMDRVSVINRPTGLYVENGELSGTLTPEGQALLGDYDSVQYYYRRHFIYQNLRQGAAE
ncbi:MAG: hypothetical protein EOM52_00800 [Clostridia bacterium]|nr:hypothetical protein [Clostridia bacterium]